MLAKKHLPENYLAWNKKYHAPFGRHLESPFLNKFLPNAFIQKYRGPFSIQPNNTTRVFEYPWAFFSLPPIQNQNILEIGGGLSGFQFILGKNGHYVINVDPGLNAKGVGWPCTKESMDKLNHIFNTSVELINTTIDGANLTKDFFDCAVCISVIEHLPLEDRINVMEKAYESLKPGGLFILTVDLFPELHPFTEKPKNEWGGNIDIQQLINNSSFIFDKGITSELFGFPDFDPTKILHNRGSYLCGQYPAFAQCFILKKPI